MGCTLAELSALKCMRKHTGRFDSPQLEVCFNRRGDAIALFCNVCHKFYVVIDGTPLKYPESALPGYVPPEPKKKTTWAERWQKIRDDNMERDGELVGRNLRQDAESWHPFRSIVPFGTIGVERAKEILKRLVRHGFVIQGSEKLAGVKRKCRVWMLTPTWKETTTCDHDPLCKGFWKAVKPNGR